MKILELKFRNNQIISYKYFNESEDLVDTFFVPIKPPLLSAFIPENIYIKRIIKENGDEIRTFFKSS